MKAVGRRRAPGVASNSAARTRAIVFADCDFDAAVEGTGRAVLRQLRPGVPRHRARLRRAADIRQVRRGAEGARPRSLKLGRPEDAATGMGPLISQEHRDKVLSYYEQARVKEGATVVTGGGVPKMRRRTCRRLPGSSRPSGPGCPRIRPWCARKSSGPAATCAPFDTEDEAVRLANDTQYGLADHHLDHESRARAPRRGDKSKSASAGSIAGSCATCARRSAARSSPASAARAACTRSSSTPSCKNVCVKL